MRVPRRERPSCRCAVASCAAVLAACTVAGCSFPDVSIGNSSDAHDGGPSVQIGDNGGSGTDPGSSGSGSSGSGSGARSESGDAGRSPWTEGDAPDGHDGTVAGGGSSGASGSGSSSSGSSGSASSGSASSGSSGSSSGTGSSSGGTGPCTCGPGQTLAYPTNIACGTVLQLLSVSVCSGPAEGFSDDGPPCGQPGTLTTCSAVGLNLNAACVKGTGSTVTQHCQ
jgi:hypothetical protein